MSIVSDAASQSSTKSEKGLGAPWRGGTLHVRIEGIGDKQAYGTNKDRLVDVVRSINVGLCVYDVVSFDSEAGLLVLRAPS